MKGNYYFSLLVKEWTRKDSKRQLRYRGINFQEHTSWKVLGRADSFAGKLLPRKQQVVTYSRNVLADYFRLCACRIRTPEATRAWRMSAKTGTRKPSPPSPKVDNSRKDSVRRNRVENASSNEFWQMLITPKCIVCNLWNLINNFISV